MQPQTQRLIVALIDPANRRQAARRLAEHIGASDLIVFVRDPEIGRSLPAPGFPQTLPQGQRWRSFLDQCLTHGRQQSELPLPGLNGVAQVVGIAATNGTVMALCGGQPRPKAIEEASVLLPLLGAALRSEQVVIAAAGDVRAARAATAQAQALAARLDATRSELQKALVEAETATRAKDEFLAVVSHELRTPLNAILGWARMLGSGKLDDEMIKRSIETIERNAKLQAQLIEDILDYSRTISGRLRLDVSPLELAPVIEAAIDVVRPAAEAKEVCLQTILDPHAGPISGDSSRLQQVMWNLLANAVKFTPKGGCVQVRLERVNSHATITVSDTGEGISAEFLPYVFERFRQADNTSTRRHGGLGLGLAITRHLVELHGGTISAHSAGEGMGATFIVHLPLLIAYRRAPFSPLANDTRSLAEDYQVEFADLPRLDGLHVLIVEDDADARDLLMTMLTRSGAKVTAAAAVAEALECWQSAKPDLIVSDIEMQGEDGYSFIRKVRAAEQTGSSTTPAIALTAHARFSDRIRALSAGYQMHVPKPVEPAELVVVIANLARRG